MNPLLFMPSPRDIPQVKKLWTQLPYDKLIKKYMTQKQAYAEAKEYFLDHKKYDRFVICADDLEVTPAALETLLEDSKKYDVVDGICNLDESMPDYYDIQPLGCNISGEKPQTRYRAWYMKNEEPKLPNVRFLQVGHSGAACRVIKREVFERLSFTGARQGEGWFDFQMTKELTKLGIPIMVDTSVLMYHRRTAQKPINEHGYSLVLFSSAQI